MDRQEFERQVRQDFPGVFDGEMEMLWMAWNDGCRDMWGLQRVSEDRITDRSTDLAPIWEPDF